MEPGRCPSAAHPRFNAVRGLVRIPVTADAIPPADYPRGGWDRDLAKTSK